MMGLIITCWQCGGVAGEWSWGWGEGLYGG